MEEEYARKNETTSYIIVRVDARDGDWDRLRRERETPGPRCRPEEWRKAEIGSKKGTVYV